MLRDEAAALLAAPLDPPLRVALRSLLSECSTLVPQMLDNRSTLVPQMLNTPAAPLLEALDADEPRVIEPALLSEDDPLATVGFEV